MKPVLLAPFPLTAGQTYQEHELSQQEIARRAGTLQQEYGSASQRHKTDLCPSRTTSQPRVRTKRSLHQEQVVAVLGAIDSTLTSLTSILSNECEREKAKRSRLYRFCLDVLASQFHPTYFGARLTGASKS